MGQVQPGVGLGQAQPGVGLGQTQPGVGLGQTQPNVTWLSESPGLVTPLVSLECSRLVLDNSHSLKSLKNRIKKRGQTRYH